MNPIDRNKIWKMVGILALITVVAGGLLRVSQHSSYTLGDYATDNPSLAYQTSEPSPTPEPTPAVDNSNANATENLQEGSSMAETTVLTGYSLNGELLTDQRITLSEGFYYEPLSEKLNLQSPRGIFFISSSHRMIAGLCEKLAKMTCSRESSCSLMARLILGWEWPSRLHHQELTTSR